VPLVTVRATAETLDRIALAENDLRAAGRIGKLDLVRAAGPVTVTCDL